METSITKTGKKRSQVFIWSITVALAGFLFGFDTAVISGADQPIQKLWGTSDLFHGTFIMSMALWGTVIGALLGGIPCDYFGRKKTLFWIGVLYFISAAGSALAVDPYTFSFFRFIGGLGVGASSVAAPTYISEIAPFEKRGRLVALYQFNIVFGILIAYVSNALLGGLGEETWKWIYSSEAVPAHIPDYLIYGIGENSWRWMLGLESFPAIIYLILVMGVPESPRWLILKAKDTIKAKSLLEKLNPGKDIQWIVDEIKESSVKTSNSGIFSGKYNFVILLAFLLAFFNQLSGINFVIYYAPRIFEAANLGEGASLLSTAGNGLVNLIFTLIGMYLIDRAGRKTLMYIGSFGYIVSLALLSWAFYTEAEGLAVVYFSFMFIASHAIGQGAVIWVFISEIFPNNVRAFGQALGSGTHWVFAAAITLLMPAVLRAFDGGPIFAFFSFMMVLQLLFVIFMMPETKGVPLEELQEKLIKEKV